MRLPVLMAAGLVLTAGCELVNQTVMFDVAERTRDISVSHSLDFVWTKGQLSEVVAYRVEDAELMETIGPFASPVNIVDFDKEYTLADDDDVWLLHANGLRTRWNPDGSFTGIEGPVPMSQFPADTRNYLQLAREPDGVSFMLADDTVNGVQTRYVYRHDNGQWSRVVCELGCNQIDYDIAADELAVRVYPGEGDPHVAVRWYEADSLTALEEVDLEEFYSPIMPDEFESLNRHTITTNFVHGPDGLLTDYADPVYAGGGTDLVYGDNTIRMWWQGSLVQDEPVIGRYDLQ